MAACKAATRAGLSQPFRLEYQTRPVPRALPWAKLSNPVGVKTGHPTGGSNRCETAKPRSLKLLVRERSARHSLTVVARTVAMGAFSSALPYGRGSDSRHDEIENA